MSGHEWVVYGLAFTPDGGRLVSGSADGTIRLWDVPGRRLVETYRWHQSWITCVTVAPDGMIERERSRAQGPASGSWTKTPEVSLITRYELRKKRMGMAPPPW